MNLSFQLYYLRYLKLTILILFIPLSIDCQELKFSETIVNIAEDLAADETDPEAVTLFIEQLHELLDDPVSINSSDEAELSRLFFLSDFQIKAIADHVRSTGAVVSVYEIASIPGFDRQIAEIMTPFITLVTDRTFSPDTLIFRNRLLTNLIIKPDDSDTNFIGSSLKSLAKYKVTAGNYSAGITAEKDAGEKFFSGSPPLPDFFSAHLAFNGRGVIRKLIAGDFSARFGQGTVINTGMHSGLSLTATGYLPGRDEVKPYTSTDENNFFRGVAAELALKQLKLSLLFSRNRIDAKTGSSYDSTSLFAENFYKTGLHNTSSLLMNKDAMNETFYGINITYNFSLLTLGFNWSESRFSIPVHPTGNSPEDLYDFKGNKNRNCSVYYNSLINKVLLFGEISFDYAYNFAVVQGFTLRPSDRLTINFLYRNYSPGFISFHGRGPGNNSATGNEQGILGNLTFEAAKYLFVSAGCDIIRFPWLKYRTGFPSMTTKQEVKIRYLPSENLSLELSYNHRLSMTDKPKDQGIPGVEEIAAGTFKSLAKYSVNESLTLTARIDCKAVKWVGSKGMLMSQDIVYKFRQIPVVLWFRYCIFNTDDWDSRLYIYENDLLYSFSIPAFSGEGSRSYIMAKWEINNIAELRIKYGITSLTRNGDYPEGRDELRMQFRIWF